MIRLIEDTAVREQAKKLVSILRQEGIDRIHAYYSGGEGLVIDREDIPCFEAPNSEEELQNEERKMTLQIISLIFKDDNKWRFTDGAEPFNALIEDVDFLKKIAENKNSFAKNDYLVCIVRERQAITTKGLKKSGPSFV